MTEAVTGLIYANLANIMNDVDSIGKDSRNVQQGFNYRGIDAVMNHLHLIFAKHRVFLTTEVLEDKSEERTTRNGGALIYRILRIKFNFYAIDGSSVSAVVVGEGMDSGDKAANKAMAVGLKYALTQMLLLPYDEVDPDGESHEVAPKVRQEVKPAPKKAASPSPERTESSGGTESTSQEGWDPEDWRLAQVPMGKNKGAALGTLPSRSLWWYIDEYKADVWKDKNGKEREPSDTSIQFRKALDRAKMELDARSDSVRQDAAEVMEKKNSGQDEAPTPVSAEPAEEITDNGIPF